jgi:DNA-3-methyladenine glycosylase II
MAEAWRPWRGVAAHLLWAYYHVVKRREGISLQPAQPKAKLTAKTARRKPAKTANSTKTAKTAKRKKKNG